MVWVYQAFKHVDLQRFCEALESSIFSSFTFFFCVCVLSSSCSFLAEQVKDRRNRRLLENTSFLDFSGYEQK